MLSAGSPSLLGTPAITIIFTKILSSLVCMLRGRGCALGLAALRVPLVFAPWALSAPDMTCQPLHSLLMEEFFKLNMLWRLWKTVAIGIRCKDGVVFGVEKLVLSKLYEEGSNKRLFNVDRHVGIAVTGSLADARSLADIAREGASNFRSNFGYNIPLKHLADRVTMYVHAYTLYSAVRPFGCGFILESYSVNDGAQLYMTDPSGVCMVIGAVPLAKPGKLQRQK